MTAAASGPSETAAAPSETASAPALPPYDAPPPRPTGPAGARPFLAPLMGAGSGLGAGLTMAEIMADPALRSMGMALWEQMRADLGGATAPRAAVAGGEDASGETDHDRSAEESEHRTRELRQLLEAGTGGEIDTASSRAEILKYRDRLAFSADLLETLLEETYLQLENLERYLALTEPRPAPADAAAGATAGSADGAGDEPPAAETAP